MITIKSDYELSLMRIAGRIVYDTHQYLKPYIKPGITTKELDRLAEEYILSQGCTPSFKGLYGFPGSFITCGGVCFLINSTCSSDKYNFSIPEMVLHDGTNFLVRLNLNPFFQISSISSTVPCTIILDFQDLYDKHGTSNPSYVIEKP